MASSGIRIQIGRKNALPMNATSTVATIPVWLTLSADWSTVCSAVLTLLLDRHADRAAPLGPRPVVVLDVGIAEQLLQHEPRVRGALADAAVGDDLFVRDDALAA